MHRGGMIMFEFMDGFMPRKRRNGFGTITSMLLGASVGIAAWEIIRRNTNMNQAGNMDIEKMADTVMNSMQV
jgi:hypothetical protein